VGQPQIQILPITSDNQLSAEELKQSVVVKGQVSGLNASQLSTDQPIMFKLDGKSFKAKLDSTGTFSGIIDQQALKNSATKLISVEAISPQGQALIHSQRHYSLLDSSQSRTLDIDLDPIVPVQLDSKASTELKGKVIKPYSSQWLYFAIIVDNMASGLAGAAFIAFLSSLTSVSFTAVQYAIFSSLMTLTPKLLGGYSGTIVTHIGYPKFFLMTTLIGIPILILVVWVAKLLREHQALESEKINP